MNQIVSGAEFDKHGMESSPQHSLRAARFKQRMRAPNAGGKTTLARGEASARNDRSGKNASASDFMRVMRALLWLSPPARNNNKGDEVKIAWQPRTALDSSAHSFSKTLQAEIVRAKRGREPVTGESACRKSDPHRAAMRHEHLAQLHSPKKNGLRSHEDGTDAPSSWWGQEGSRSKDSLCRTSSVSTSPPSPPASSRGDLPPRAPRIARGGRSGVGQGCASDARADAGEFTSCRHVAGGFQ